MAGSTGNSNADNKWLSINIHEIRGYSFPDSRSWYQIFSVPKPCYSIRVSSVDNYLKSDECSMPDDSDCIRWSHPFSNTLMLDPHKGKELEFSVWERGTTGNMRLLSEANKSVAELIGKERKVEVKFDKVAKMRLEVELAVEERTDPYKKYEVEHHPCFDIMVTEIDGQNFTRGWLHTYRSAPNSFVVVSMPSLPDYPCQETSPIPNSKTPVWKDQKLKFVVDKRKCLELVNGERRGFKLAFTVKDRSFVSNENLGTAEVHVKELRDGIETQEVRLKATFGKVPEMSLDITLIATTIDNKDLRIHPGLCDAESRFLDARQINMKRIMKNDPDQDEDQKIPTIAVLGSGGGFRAMIGYAGAMSALKETGILDLVTYNVGLSGSAWYLSTLYSHPDWPEKTDSLDGVKTEIRHSLLTTTKWQNYSKSLGMAVFKISAEYFGKKAIGKADSFTDLYGKYIGDILLKKRQDSKLTDQAKKIEAGECPMPLYSCIHVKDHESASDYHEWVEFSPYEIGIPKYDVYIKPELFGSRFEKGNVIQNSEEMPLYSLQGIWGSAFCIQLLRLMRGENYVPTLEDLRHAENQRTKFARKTEQRREDIEHNKNEYTWWNYILERMPFMNTIHQRSAQICSFMYKLELVERRGPDEPDVTEPHYRVIPEDPGYRNIFDMTDTNEERMYMVDAGLAFNSPYPPILRKERKVDLILSFDFSARKNDTFEDAFKELLLAEKWAEANRLPFPNIQSVLPEITAEEKEYYIFEKSDAPDCPTVIHFVLVNKSYEEKFDIFDDEDGTYSTFRLYYDGTAFDNLWKLMKYNTELAKEDIISIIKKLSKA